MKALSIRQPWASLILGTCITGVPKDIENRTWRTHYRGPLLIHASSICHPEYDWGEAWEFIFSCPRLKARVHLPHMRTKEFPLGGIIGQVDVVDCVESSDSPWFNGPFGFVLANPKPLPFYACRGRQGLFDIEIPPTLL